MRFRLVTAHRPLVASIVCGVLSSFSAWAQQPVDTLAVEIEGRDKKPLIVQAVPVGPSTLIFASPRLKPDDDADKRLKVLGNGAPADSVEIETAISIALPDAPLWLVVLKMPQGVSFEAKPQVKLDEELMVQVAAQRGSGDKPQAWLRNILVAPDAEGLKLERLTPSTPLPDVGPFPFVYDLCGAVVGLVTEADGAQGAIIPAADLSAKFSQFNGGNGFVQAPDCAFNETDENRKARLKAVDQQLADDNKAAEEDRAELNRKLEAAERRNNKREIEALKAEIAKQSDLSSALSKRDEERNLLAADVDKRAAIREEELKVAKGVGAENANAANNNLLIAIAVGALALLALAFAAFLFFRSRSLKTNLDVARKEKAKAEKAKEAASARWNDCLLESDGATLKLPGDKLPKSRGGVVVGRSREDADVLLDREDVSRRHARFEEEGGVLEVIDLGATNRTRVNDVVLEQGVPRRLYDGDMVALGRTKFKFRVLRGDE